MTLPSGPPAFMFGDASGKSSEKVTLPSGPQILMFGDASAQSTEKVTLPSGLQTSTVGDPVALTTTLRCAEESLTDEAGESLSVEAEESLAEESAGQPSLTAHAATFAAAAAAAAAAAVTVFTAGATTTAVTVVPVVSAEVPPLPPVPLPVTHGWTVPQIIWTTVPSFLGTFPLFPFSLRSFWALSNFPQGGLQTVTIAGASNLSLEIQTLPCGLRTFTLGDANNQSLEKVTMSIDPAECPLLGGGKPRPGQDASYGLAAVQNDVAKLAAQLAKLGKRITQIAKAPKRILWDEQPQGTSRPRWADVESDTEDGADAPSGSESDASSRRKKRVSFSDAEQQPAAAASTEALWVTIGRLVEQAKGCATPPSDQEVRAKLQSLLGPKRRQPRRKPARATADAAPPPGRVSATQAAAARRPPEKSQAPPSPAAKEGTWAEVAAAAAGKAGVTPKGGAKPKLWEGDWSAKVVGIDALPKVPSSQPTVVVTRTTEAQFEAKLWAQNRSGTTGTVVILLGTGDDPVLLHTAKGPVAGLATVSPFGAAPPTRTSRKANPQLDDTAGLAVGMGFVRITVVKSFNPELFAKVIASPSRLPALVLPAPLLSKVVRTLGAATYAEEVTCLVRARSDVLPIIEAAEVPTGAFVREHCAKADRATAANGSQPRWISRQLSESATQYLDRITSMAAGSKAKVCFRAGGTTCLGLLGGAALDASDGVIAPRWSMTNANEHWAQEEVSNWLSARAFTECGGINRRSKHAWTFRAWPPNGWSPDQSLSFSSGIIIAPAVGQNSKKAKVVAATRSVWGATPLPTPKEAAAAPDSAKKPTPAKAKARAGKARAAEQPGAKPTVAAAAARTEDGPEVATEAAATPVPADVLTGAQEDTSMNVPVQVALENTFEVIPNGGAGDCAYLAIAMAQADKDGCDLTAERFAPGGTKQRNLRGMVAKEIMKNPACYPKARLKEALSMAGKDPELYALRMSMDGVSADGTILQAIAQIYNCELRIWKVTNEAPEGQPRTGSPICSSSGLLSRVVPGGHPPWCGSC